MNSDPHTIVDSLVPLVDADTQRKAARMAQEVFAGIFRQAVAAEAGGGGGPAETLATRCHNWCRAGSGEEAQALRLALLISGLDQWGLAYSQAFDLSGIPALSALIGNLRTRLDARGDARFQWYYAQIDDVEADAIDFKVELRRSIHLALWHAMAACDDDEEASAIVRPLGSLLVALSERMPHLGWRLVADALANFQISLVGGEVASAVAQAGTQRLFESLRHALPAEQYQRILAHSAQVVLAWQQAKRAN